MTEGFIDFHMPGALPRAAEPRFLGKSLGHKQGSGTDVWWTCS